MARVNVVVLLIAAALFAAVLSVSGCYCWQPAHRNETACVVAHQTVDCTVDAVKDLVIPIAGLVMVYVQGTSTPDWGSILQRLEGLGLRNAACVLAQLEKDFAKPAAGPVQAKAKDVRDQVMAWRLSHDLVGVQFKLPGDT